MHVSRFLPRIVPCFLCVAAGFGNRTATAQTADPVFPAVNLSQGGRGGAIVAALGNRLPEVAKFYGLSAQDFSRLCQRDHDLRVDKTGRLYYACEGTVAKASTAANGGTDALLSYPESQTFLLHSKPGQTRVLYLDFNGHTTTGTQWNSAYTAGASFTTPSYDTDGNPGAFNSDELANIQQIWQRVSEDYAPWNVDVTTEAPPLESLRKTSSTDTAYGIRMVVGGSSYDWLKVGAGGVAYVGSFTWSSDTPAYVFPPQLGNGYPKYVAEAISHEAGHTVGLNHDGKTSGTQYYQGHNGWAPIMGASYYANLTQFSKGEYSLANNTQDDLAIINSYIPRSQDLVGDDILSAVPLIGSSVTATGIIESRTDADLFRINSGAGTLTFSATTASPDANVDLQLSLYDGGGNLLLTSDSVGLNSSLSANVNAGTYYVALDGVGSGTGSTGYSDYASVGQFHLAGAVPAGVGQPPVAVASQSTPLAGLAPLTVSFFSAGSYDPDGGPLTYDWDFGDGAVSNDANPLHVYSTVGSYVASLVVVDATGLSAAAAVTITVQSPANVIFVSDIVMSKTTLKRGTQANATVTIKDANGSLKPGATVTGSWSGLTSGTSSIQTNSSGQANFSSAYTKNNGTFTFSVTGVGLAGCTYEPFQNVKTSASLTK